MNFEVQRALVTK